MFHRLVHKMNERDPLLAVQKPPRTSPEESGQEEELHQGKAW
jgi:hypothetical protein